MSHHEFLNEVFMKVSAVIAAAGSGTRLGTKMPKQFLDLGGRPILAWCLQAFCSSYLISDIVVVAHPDYLELASDITDKYACSKPVKVVAGGATRQDSVLNGVRAASERATWVAVHDAARPFVTTDHIEAVCMLAGEAGAAIPGIKIPDTVKRIDENGFVIETLDRSKLVLAQTPQVCRKEELLAAYDRAAKLGIAFTDESSILEASGIHVAIATGSMHNFKVTTEADLKVARMLAAARLQEVEGIDSEHD